jgi:hypothetical protein
VHDVEFGSLSGVGARKLIFRATDSISRTGDLRFGWASSMKNPREEILVEEVVERPPGTAWEVPSIAPEVQATEGGSRAVTTRKISAGNSPVMFSNWSIIQADRVGTYRAALKINGLPVRQVEFQVTE